MAKIKYTQILRRVIEAEAGPVQIDIAQGGEFLSKLCFEIWCGDAPHTDEEILEFIHATALREMKRRKRAEREAKQQRTIKPAAQPSDIPQKTVRAAVAKVTGDRQSKGRAGK